MALLSMARLRRALGMKQGPASFEDMSIDYRQIDQSRRPPLDRDMTPAEEAALDERQRVWRREGALVLPKFIPDSVLDPYIKLREEFGRPEGWGPVPYLYYDEIKDLCLYRPLIDVLESLLGTRIVVHLNLTGWVSTQRVWHQDDYLNPPHVAGSYLAVWIALDTISPECGPFQYVPGSHRWRVLGQDRVRAQLKSEDNLDAGSRWIFASEQMVSDASDDYIRRKGGEVRSFLGQKGDVLVWHGSLLHRGSMPTVPGTPRRSFIAHYSGRKNRIDFPEENTRVYAPTGGLYQHFDQPLTFDQPS